MTDIEKDLEKVIENKISYKMGGHPIQEVQQPQRQQPKKQKIKKTEKQILIDRILKKQNA